MKGRKFTYYDTLVKSFQFVLYDTSHYRPVSPEHMAELELVSQKNDLPRLNMMLFSILKILGQKEKSEFKVQKIGDLKKWVEEQRNRPENIKDNDFVEQAENIINYLDHLDIDQIVTPIKKITEFLDEDLIATDAKYPGSIIDAVMAAEKENKRINNIPIKSKTAWLKWIAIMSFIGMIGAVLYIAYDGGAFDSVIKPLEGIGDIDFNLSPGGSASSSDFIAKYPTPESMRAAIDRGEISMSQVPADLRPLVEAVKSPGG